MMKKLDAGDPETESRDLVADNIGQLKSLFPEAFAEGKIDFDVLKQLLGGAVDERDEKYGLNWHGKRRARDLALKPSTGTLRPCPEESVDWDTTQNLMIEGDNLEVLKLLQKSYAGKVKMIYIDPPYNTGKDFVYPDDFQDGIRNYLELTGQAENGRKRGTNTEANGRFHTDWLNMMYPRLKLARGLLAPDGVIAVSIDHHELANLKSVFVGLFGEENAINTFVWVNNLKGRQISSHGAALTHEFIVVWAKTQELINEFTVRVDWAKARMPGAYKGFEYESLRDAKGEYVLKNQLYNTNSAFNESTRPNLVFNIHYNADTGEVRTTDIDDPEVFEGFTTVRPHRSSDGVHKYHAWRWSRSKVERESEDLAFVPSAHGLRVFTKVRGYANTVLKDLITDISTNEGPAEVESLLGGRPFSYPKPLSLLQLLIQSIVPPDDGALVLDFFAGSGTTGHAVAAENAVDGGDRRYIVVQLPEVLDPENADQKAAAKFCDSIGKPRNIAELTKERLRRAAKALRDENPSFAGDLGFRVFKLDSSNVRTWEPRRDDLERTLLDSVEHLKPDRTESDILHELLIKRGLDLCASIETRQIAKQAVHSIGGGAVLACLSERITGSGVEPLATGIVDWHKTLAAAAETPVIFRDSAFENDAAKANMAAILEQGGLTNVRTL